MGLFKDYVSQTRKPEGFLGKLMLKGMNSGHARMADWGLSHLQRVGPEGIVDLGCGGGRNAGELLQRFPQAHVTAIDYSQLSVEKAREYNPEMISKAALPSDMLPFRKTSKSIKLVIRKGAFFAKTA